MDRGEVVRQLHEIAAEVAGPGRGRGDGPPLSADGPGGDLTALYALSSLQAFEYLLLLEQRFGITFGDDELSREDLFSVDTLASSIIRETEGASRALSPGREPGPA